MSHEHGFAIQQSTELFHQQGHAIWYAGRSPTGAPTWTTDVLKAGRFTSREMVRGLIAWLQHLGFDVHAVEAAWAEAPRC